MAQEKSRNRGQDSPSVKFFVFYGDKISIEKAVLEAKTVMVELGEYQPCFLPRVTRSNFLILQRLNT